MTRRRIKNRIFVCTQCGERTPLLKLVTLPEVRRKRTRQEQAEHEVRRMIGIPQNSKEDFEDDRNRKVRLCHDCCIKAITEIEAAI